MNLDLRYFTLNKLFQTEGHYARHSKIMTTSVLKVLTWCRKAVHLHAKVILKEEEADDGEEVDKKDGQNSGQNNRAAIPRHTLYHIEQGLLSDHQVEQLWRAINVSENRFIQSVCL